VGAVAVAVSFIYYGIYIHMHDASWIPTKYYHTNSWHSSPSVKARIYDSRHRKDERSTYNCCWQMVHCGLASTALKLKSTNVSKQPLSNILVLLGGKGHADQEKCQTRNTSQFLRHLQHWTESSDAHVSRPRPKENYQHYFGAKEEVDTGNLSPLTLIYTYHFVLRSISYISDDSLPLPTKQDTSNTSIRTEPATSYN
jgi:hypothetical protein